MKISLLRTLVAAFALCMAVPGQAAMAGDVGSGGEPGVQQEVDTGVRFSSVPYATRYVGIYDYEDFGHTGREWLNFSLENFSSDMFIRIQVNNGSNVSLTFDDPNTGESSSAIELDANNGYWVPSEYIGGTDYVYMNGSIL